MKSYKFKPSDDITTKEFIDILSCVFTNLNSKEVNQPVANILPFILIGVFSEVVIRNIPDNLLKYFEEIN